MAQTLTISDDLYTDLDEAARRRGVSIEELLRTWQATDPSCSIDAEIRRRAAFARVAALGDELSARYGAMPDSTELIREDRAR